VALFPLRERRFKTRNRTFDANIKLEVKLYRRAAVSEHLPETEDSPLSHFFSKLYFTQIFRGFRLAIQPSKMILALAGIILIYFAGSFLDSLTPGHMGVVTNPGLIDAEVASNHLEAYVRSGQSDAELYNQRLIQAIDIKRERLLANSTSLADEQSTSEEIEGAYSEHVETSLDILEKCFEFREGYVWDQYKNSLKQINRKEDAVDRIKRQRKENLEGISVAYSSLFEAVTYGAGKVAETERWIQQLIRVDDRTQGKMLADERKYVENDQRHIRETILLAEIWHLTQARQGQGVFATLNEFYGQRFMTLVSSLILKWDIPGARQAIVDSMMGFCWLSRYHAVYGFFLLLVWLVVWSIFGGAICRMSAIQFTRDERMGPFEALKFSGRKFLSFFTAPLMPLFIIALLALMIYLISWIGALPFVGEILAGLLLGLALAVGFIMALVAIGFVGGVSLMYPTIAVEGSDNFDSISRSFSYVLGRPWHMGFYSLVALVYGGICFLFVRLFALVLLLSVRVPMQAAMNVDGSSKISIRGKLDAIWPAPSFSDLYASVDFSGLGGSESLSAFFIWIWVSIVVGLTVAFAVSFHFSVNTIIYILLRKHKDATDFDDVFIEEPQEETLEDGEPTISVSNDDSDPKPEDD
jgi:hypothetical protein